MGVNFRELCKSSFKNCSKFFPLFKRWGELRKSVNERNVGFRRLSHDCGRRELEKGSVADESRHRSNGWSRRSSLQTVIFEKT